MQLARVPDEPALSGKAVGLRAPRSRACRFRRQVPASLEMESFTLLHLAACSRGSIAAASCAIVCANRQSGAVIETAELHRMEAEAGRAVLSAITAFPLEHSPHESRTTTASATPADPSFCV